MNILEKTILALSKEEIINYKLYANRKAISNERKDILLFDLIKKSGLQTIDDSSIFEKLYPNPENKNVYYQLKNRLLTEVNTSLVQFYFQETDIHFVYGELGLYKLHLAKNEWEVALYHLKKAEKKALDIQDYSMLDVIYTEQINLSVQFGDVSPTIYKQKRNENRLKLDNVRILDDALADIIYELKRNQTFGKTKSDITSVLNKAIKDLNSRKEFKDNLAFKTKVYNAISRLLLSQKDFASLENYTIKTFNEFCTKHYFSKANHQLKLQMLAYICNTLAANNKKNEALKYVAKLFIAMKEYNNLLFNSYVFFYYNALANNYSASEPTKAIEALNEAKENLAIKNHPQHLGYVYLNLAGAHFDLKQYKIALKHIIKLYTLTVFENIDEAFKLKIIILEVVLRIETNDLEYAHRLIEKLVRTNKILLKNEEYQHDVDFLNLIKKLIHKFSFNITKQSKLVVEQFCNKKYNYDSTHIVKYNHWLKEKFKLQ